MSEIRVFTVKLDNPKHRGFSSSGNINRSPNEPVYIKADVILKSDHDLEVAVLKAKLDKAVEQRNDEINSTNNPFAIDIEHKINRLNSELNSITKETVK